MHLKSKGVEAFTLQPGSTSHSLLFLSQTHSHGLKLTRKSVPQTDLYIHTNAATDPNDPASFPAAFSLLRARYGDNGPFPSGDPKEDEKTLETASSTLLFAMLSPSLDGMFTFFLIMIIEGKELTRSDRETSPAG
jgi:hypothetical protein